MHDQAFLVSLIVPVYNAENFLRRAVESAITLHEVREIILIEDGSVDTSLEVCRQLEREYQKVRLIRHPDHGNHGAGASRNLGIACSQFEFIAFLDADDYYLPHRFQQDREILLENDSVDGVYGAIGIHYDSEEARQKFIDAGFEYQEFLTVSEAVSAEELIDVLFCCHPEVTGEFHTIAITVRKRLFARSGLFNERLRLWQDIHLWRRMAAIGRLEAGCIDRPIAVRGVHEANRMTDRTEHLNYLDYWWEDLREWMQDNPEVPNRAQKAFRRAYCQYQVNYRSKWEGRFALIQYALRYPRIIFQRMGFFDLNLFEAFGRNWFTLHLTSVKNRFIQMR